MADRDRLIAILNRVWNFRHNSLAAYILAADPFLPEGKAGLLEPVKQAARMDQDLAQALLPYFEELKTSPQAVPYEPLVSELNYLSIDYLCRVLQEKLQEELIRLEAEKAEVGEAVVGNEILTKAIEATKSQLALLN